MGDKNQLENQGVVVKRRQRGFEDLSGSCSKILVILRKDFAGEVAFGLAVISISQNHLTLLIKSIFIE